MSESLEITDATTAENFIKTIQFQDLVDAYIQALQTYRAKQASLTCKSAA